MTKSRLLGWYVRVTTSKFVEGNSATQLYVAGFIDPTDAEGAVRASRNVPGETYLAVQSAVEGIGIQVRLGEVRAIPGAV